MIGGYMGGQRAPWCRASPHICSHRLPGQQRASFPYDMRSWKLRPARSVGAQRRRSGAQSQPTCVNSVLNQTAGPAVGAPPGVGGGHDGLTVSGPPRAGTRSAGENTNYLTPLEIKFAGEVFKRTAGMGRARATTSPTACCLCTKPSSGSRPGARLCRVLTSRRSNQAPSGSVLR
jgi:hypothetical protein